MFSLENKDEKPEIDQEIDNLFKADQEDRHEDVSGKAIEELKMKDLARLTEAHKILKVYKQKGIVLSGEYLWKLGVLFHHGKTIENYQIAISLAQDAINKGYPTAIDLLHAAEDRYLLETTGTQKWGTQEIVEEQ